MGHIAFLEVKIIGWQQFIVFELIFILVRNKGKPGR